MPPGCAELASTAFGNNHLIYILFLALERPISHCGDTGIPHMKMPTSSMAFSEYDVTVRQHVWLEKRQRLVLANTSSRGFLRIQFYSEAAEKQNCIESCGFQSAL
jgi:hypothetical protein